MKTITVTATGRASAPPDRIRVGMELTLCREDYTAAMQDAEQQLSALQSAVAQCGFEPGALKTEQFRVHPRYEQPQHGNKLQFCGFEVSHGLSLRMAMDTALLAQLLSAVTASGCDPVLSISFELENTEALAAAALKDAVEAARFRAEVLSCAAGQPLGELQEIRHGDDGIVPPCASVYSVAAMRSVSDAAVDVTPKDIETEETVTMVWSLLQ